MRCFKVTMAFACLLAFADGASSAVVPDQSFVASPTRQISFITNPTTRKCQTFTAGVAGSLDSVEVQASGDVGGHIDGAQVLATSGGVPTSIVLANSSDFTSSGEWLHFDFQSSALSMTPGEVFAIELLSADGKWFGDWSSTTDLYAGGQPWYTNSDVHIDSWVRLSNPPMYEDLNFRTFVSIPEPSTLVLLAAGVISLLAYAWRRRKRTA